MKSILFSLFQHFWTLSFLDALADTWTAARGIVRALRSRTGDAKLMGDIRTRVCERCDFYDAKWKTCGTPGETMGEPFGIKVKVGCWCYLPLANRDPKKDCYARAHDLHSPDGKTVGWPDVLRPTQETNERPQLCPHCKKNYCTTRKGMCTQCFLKRVLT